MKSLREDSGAAGLLLNVDRLCFSYEPGKPVLQDISFQLEQGKLMTILGSNGSGKSTLLSCLGQKLHPKEGSVEIDGVNISGLTPSELALKVGYVGQNQTLAFDFPVRDYLVLGFAPHLGLFNLPGQEEYEKVDDVLERMKITHLADKSMLRISGGERQQAEIARVLVQRPRLILMDEPTNHLDYGNQLKVLKIIVELAENENIAVILTTHMPDHAILLEGSAGIITAAGHFVSGPVDSVITEETLREIYRTELKLAYVDVVGRRVCLPCSIRR